MSSFDQYTTSYSLRTLDGGSGIDGVLCMMERKAPAFLNNGDVGDFAATREGKSPLDAEMIHRIRRLYAAAQRRGPVNTDAIAATCGVCCSTVRKHTRDLREPRPIPFDQTFHMAKSPPLPIRHVNLSAIQFDSATQVRAEIDNDTVTEYASAMAAGEEFPAAMLFQGGHQYWIGDGWHRLIAAQRNGVVTFPCAVGVGGRTAAIRFALSANAHHGKKRTNVDKRRAVEVALKEFANLSNVEIAQICLVSSELVRALRGEIQPPEIGSSYPRLGGDGKWRKQPKSSIIGAAVRATIDLPPSRKQQPAAHVTTDAKTLAEWVRAYADGMPVAEIARSYKVPEADVRGALQLEPPPTPAAAQPASPAPAEAPALVLAPTDQTATPEPKEAPLAQWSIVQAVDVVQASIQGQLARAPESMVAALKTELVKMCAEMCGVTVLDQPADPFGDRHVIPPLPAWVTAYSASIGYAMDGQKWCDEYEKKGWMIAKNKMKDWQATVRTWRTNRWGLGTITLSARRPDRPTDYSRI